MSTPAAARDVDSGDGIIGGKTFAPAVDLPSSIAARFSLALAVALPAPTPGAPAGSEAPGPPPIQRCETARGAIVYTDTACARFRARPTPLSADLLARIAAANAAGMSIVSTEAAWPGDDRGPGARPPLSGIGRRAPAAGCARTPRQLSRDLIGSFALRDVNRVAESYHWAGLSHSQSMPVMRQLERLAAQPLADARFLAAWIGPAGAAPKPSVAGLMQLVFAGGDARVMDFAVRRHSGCYFISF